MELHGRVRTDDRVWAFGENGGIFINLRTLAGSCFEPAVGKLARVFAVVLADAKNISTRGDDRCSQFNLAKGDPLRIGCQRRFNIRVVCDEIDHVGYPGDRSNSTGGGIYNSDACGIITENRRKLHLQFPSWVVLYWYRPRSAIPHGL